MTLNVPLTVRLGDRHITRHVQALTFRKEAVGGLRNITFRLHRKIQDLEADLAPFTKAYVYDGRTAECIGEARLSDSGRTADPGGQAWEVAAFGPVQHASDITRPYIAIDRSWDGWEPFEKTSPEASFGGGNNPDNGAVGILGQWPTGIPAAIDSRVTLRYKRLQISGQKLGGYGYTFASGVTDANWEIESIALTDDDFAGQQLVSSNTFTTVVTAVGALVVTNFTNGRNNLALRIIAAAANTPATDRYWSIVTDPVLRALLVDKTGAEVLTGYATPSVLASEVAADLVGSRLDQFDGASSVIETTTEAIEQLAYPDGATPAQILEDLMQIEPAYRWYATPDVTGNGYVFHWEAWPTQVRYEVTLDDGGSFPLSGQTLYNRVGVHWKNEAGHSEFYTLEMACPALDDAGITRQATISLGSEVGSQAAATAAAAAFLEQHNVPTNSGTINVSRPIRDVITGRMVDPWEIEPGELIRVRGVESYPDALNADSNDGKTVFRIFAMDYSSESNTASLELDADPHTTTAALKKLFGQVSRMRRR